MDMSLPQGAFKFAEHMTNKSLLYQRRPQEPSMGEKRKTQHEFIREAIKEAVERMKPELHAASEAAHHLIEEVEAHAGLFSPPRHLLVDFWTYGCINCTRTLPY